MELKDKILLELKKSYKLKAKDIAKAIGDVNVKEVNSILYGVLKGKVSQNASYEWSLDNNQSANISKSNNSKQKADTELSRLSAYYLDCISKDLDSGISVWASNKYGKPDYVQLSKLILDEPFELEREKVSHLIGKLSKERHALNVNLGYPIYLHRVTSKTGQVFYQVKPVLIQKVNKDSFLFGRLELLNESPFVNPEVASSQEGSSSSELLQDLLLLNQELGLDNIELPQIDEISARLQMIRGNWDWQEDLDCDNLSNIDLTTTVKPGIYNCCAIFLSEGSKYTVGLEQELTNLQYIPDDILKDSILAKMIKGNLGKVELQDKVLIEPLQMNEEQRDAIVRGLQSELTVVTGPPGTGKSQVVSNLIINAVYDGQKVLFASRNNKAVDVVLQRVNGLSNKPVMLRLGGTEKQDDLSKYLTSILATNINLEDQQNFDESNFNHTKLLGQIEILRAQHNSLIALRNEVDILEQDIEELRNVLGEDVIKSLRSHSHEELTKISKFAQTLNEEIQKANKSNWSLFEKIFAFLYEKKRAESLLNFIQKHKHIFQSIHINEFQLNTNDLISSANKISERLEKRLLELRNINKYFSGLYKLTEGDSIYEIICKEKALIEEISYNSNRLWQQWLQLLPSRLSQKERVLIGDYLTVLNLIVKSNSENSNVESGIWAKYYSLLPKVTNILSCWAVTSLSVRSKVPFEPGFFDLLIIDEASQCDIASAIPLFYRSKRAVIIGDDKQLTFITKISTKEDHQLIEKHSISENFLNWSYSSSSVFRLSATLCRGENIIELKDHHRSHFDIISYSNKNFYNDNLRIATNYSNLVSVPNEPALRWIDVKGKVIKPTSGGAVNDIEAQRVVTELRRLVSMGYKGTLGVVSPFRAQATRIKDIVFSDPDLTDRLMNKDFLADTVHKFQGDERDLIIFSTVVSEGISNGSESFLRSTGNLFNVAITRARAGLIVVGDRAACIQSSVDHFSRFANHVKSINDNNKQIVDNNHSDLGPQYPTVYSKDIVSDWEKILYEELYKRGIKTLPQYKVDKYSLDLALIIGDRKLDIEVDGEAYHRSWNGELVRRDKIRNKRMIELGWDVQRFWVYEVRDNLNSCISRVENWIKN